MNKENLIAFRCPECHEQTKVSIHSDGIFADPSLPCLRCEKCLTYWRITLAFCKKASLEERVERLKNETLHTN